MVSRARPWLLVSLTLLVLGGCDRLRLGEQAEDPQRDAERAKCRQGCGATYKDCLQDCKNDSPQACESRCDLRQKKCVDQCANP